MRCLLIRKQWMHANNVNAAQLSKVVQWEPFETTITRQSLLWLGHLAQMKKTRLPKQAFFGFWAGHKTRQWYQLAQNREAWKAAVLNQFPLQDPSHEQTIALNRWDPSRGRPLILNIAVERTARVRPRTLPKNPESGQYQCPICNIQFRKANSLKFHYDSHHAVANTDLVTAPTYAKMKQEHDCPARPRAKRNPPTSTP